MVGFAADHISLPEDAIEFSIGFYLDIQTRTRVYKLNNLLRNDIKVMNQAGTNSKYSLRMPLPCIVCEKKTVAVVA